MNIIGHKKIIKFLDKSCEKNNLAGAYLFSGPSGVGKFRVAEYLAEKILGSAQSRINDTVVILEADKEKSSDESAAEEKKTKDDKLKLKKGEIKVAEVRELRRKLSLSSEGGQKVAIIRGAEKLNKSSQNALLKILEEPNEGLTMILVADDEKKLFPTILSRCQKIRFGIVSDEEMEQLIDSRTKNLSAKAKQDMIFWSIGRPGLVLEMLGDPEKLKFKSRSFSEVKDIFQKSVLDKFALAENLAKNPKLTLEKMDIWSVGIRRLLLEGGSGWISREKGLELIEKINQSQIFLKQTNANAKLVLENMLLAFSKK